mgnify:CR=1
MKSKLKSGLKIYLSLILFVLLVCFVYAFYLNKTNQEYHPVLKLFIGSISFLLLGLFYGNAVHKRGIFVGLFVAVVHLLLLKLIFFLSVGNYMFTPLSSAIYILCSGIGGILGISFKKIF